MVGLFFLWLVFCGSACVVLVCYRFWVTHWMVWVGCDLLLMVFIV